MRVSDLPLPGRGNFAVLALGVDEVSGRGDWHALGTSTAAGFSVGIRLEGRTPGTFARLAKGAIEQRMCPIEAVAGPVEVREHVDMAVCRGGFLAWVTPNCAARGGVPR